MKAGEHGLFMVKLQGGFQAANSLESLSNLKMHIISLKHILFLMDLQVHEEVD
jgi:hypothetical protein